MNSNSKYPPDFSPYTSNKGEKSRDHYIENLKNYNFCFKDVCKSGFSRDNNSSPGGYSMIEAQKKDIRIKSRIRLFASDVNSPKTEQSIQKIEEIQYTDNNRQRRIQGDQSQSRSRSRQKSCSRLRPQHSRDDLHSKIPSKKMAVLKVAKPRDKIMSRAVDTRFIQQNLDEIN